MGSKRENRFRVLAWVGSFSGGVVVGAIVLAVLGCGGLLLLLAVGTFVEVPVAQRPFDAAAWRAADAFESGSARQAMLDDLRRNHLRPGMAWDEVRTLVVDLPEVARAGELDVPVGPSRAPLELFAMQLLVLTFDEGGLLVATRVETRE